MHCNILIILIATFKLFKLNLYSNYQVFFPVIYKEKYPLVTKAKINITFFKLIIHALIFSKIFFVKLVIGVVTQAYFLFECVDF